MAAKFLNNESVLILYGCLSNYHKFTFHHYIFQIQNVPDSDCMINCHADIFCNNLHALNLLENIINSYEIATEF